MSLIRPEDATILTRLFADELVNPVTLKVFTQARSHIQVPVTAQLEQECKFCEDTRKLAEELAALSDRIHVEVLDFQVNADKARQLAIDKIPAIAVLGDKDYGIRFYGIPSGYEFSVLVEDVLRVSKRDSGLAPETRNQLHSLTKDVHLQVFVTPTCPYCPQAVRLAHQMAMESDKISADSVEATEFPHIANRYGVRGVPKTILTDEITFEGAVPEPALLEAVLTAGKP